MPLSTAWIVRFLVASLLAGGVLQLPAAYSMPCAETLANPSALSKNVRAYPREIDPAQTFDALVQWVHDEIIVKRGAPGLAIGISGTDSIVAFLVCAKAFERA